MGGAELTPDLQLFKDLFWVGNPDAYASQNDDGSYMPWRRGEFLDWDRTVDGVLRNHLRGHATVGVYTVRPKTNDTKLLVWDFDTGDQAAGDAETLTRALFEMGFTWNQTLIESSGRKGMHVWCFLDEYLPASMVRRAGLAALYIAELPMSTEVFPKQTKVTDLGNLIKLPCGIHRVTWNWSQLLAPSDLASIQCVTREQIDALANRYHRRAQPQVVHDGPPPKLEGMPPCIARITQEGVPQGQRHNALFTLGCWHKSQGTEQGTAEAAVAEAGYGFDPPVPPEQARKRVRAAYSGPYRGIQCSQWALHNPAKVLCSTSCPRYPLYVQPLGLLATDDGPPPEAPAPSGNTWSEGEVLTVELQVLGRTRREDGKVVLVVSHDDWEEPALVLLQ